MKNKKSILLAVILLVVVVLALASSYALFRFNVTKNSNFKLGVGNLELTITDTKTEDKYIMENTVPTKDDVALESDGYTFTLKNKGSIDSYYIVYLDDILLSDSGDRLDNSYVKFNLFNHKTNNGDTRSLIDYPSVDREITTGFLKAGESITYTLRMWVDYNAGNDAQNKYFATQIRVVGTQQNSYVYTEKILNGADPVLSGNLIPVMISNNGTVTKANIQEEWYNYEDKKWANAVILKDESIKYENGNVIPENNIESYFVWIPKYSYQLWDLGNYSSLTAIDSTKPHAIPIKFGLNNTTDSVAGECTTPGTAGASGNCKVGDYMTHPTFLAFDSNGMWVGKFETGYDGATSTVGAEQNVVDTSKIVIKPNTYSWRNITVGNIFKNGYDYNRNLDSHAMKNTEWGAVAYLQHSTYGSATSVRINNNSEYITGYASIDEPTKGPNTNNVSIEGNRNESTSLGVDGTYTKNYLNSVSVVASTTGNYTGVYDMSGGAWDYVFGYTTGASSGKDLSKIISLYPNFFTDSTYTKYWDKYESTIRTNYSNRILGDATGELGSFGTQTDLDNVLRNKSSWYNDRAQFLESNYPWFLRGAAWYHGTSAGSLTFSNDTGGNIVSFGFRIILTPTK